MTREELLADAAQADREADAISTAMEAAAKPDALGFRPLVPPGFEADAAHASDLRREARLLRKEAGLETPRLSPPSHNTVPESAASEAPFAPPGRPSGAADAAEAIAARILASDTVSGATAHTDDKVEAAAARIAASDEAPEDDGDADVIAARILEA
jgi:hypothetical protein